jgi:hypothetical protein
MRTMKTHFISWKYCIELSKRPLSGLRGGGGLVTNILILQHKRKWILHQLNDCQFSRITCARKLVTLRRMGCHPCFLWCTKGHWVIIKDFVLRNYDAFSSQWCLPISLGGTSKYGFHFTLRRSLLLTPEISATFYSTAYSQLNSTRYICTSLSSIKSV